MAPQEQASAGRVSLPHPPQTSAPALGEKRINSRWPVEVAVRLLHQGRIFPATILNVNLGGCFFEGRFPFGRGDSLRIQSDHLPCIDGVEARVMWVVEDASLGGVGVKFDPMEDEQKFTLLNWFHGTLPPEPDPRRKG